MSALCHWHSTFKWQRATLSSDRVMSSHRGGDSVRILTHVRLAQWKLHGLKQGFLLENQERQGFGLPLWFFQATLHPLLTARCGLIQHSLFSANSVVFSFVLSFS